MKICLIGQNLTNLILANVFQEKKLNVDIYLSKKFLNIKTNRTPLLDNNNIKMEKKKLTLSISTKILILLGKLIS